jgi:retron-type reverse transcriptase
MAKTYDNLYGELTHFHNLCLAYRKAARGKRGQPAVAAFEFDLEGQVLRLQEELQNKTYQPGAYRSFYVREAKRRLISAAPFRDRVVHHALCNVIEPIFERTFIADSYANRIGKGTHRALDRAQALAQCHPYVLQCDVEQFFPSVDHIILRDVLAGKIADSDVLWLIESILASGEGVLRSEYSPVYFPGDDLFAIHRPRGLPIGNLTSQFWANVYLNELDQFVKRTLHCRAYLRYVDDFLLFSEDKRQLWAWKAAIAQFLVGLRLTLHQRESTVYPVSNGIPFLGFRLYDTHRRLKRRNGVSFARRLRQWYTAVAQGELALQGLHARVQGWVAHAEHGNTWGLRRSLLSTPIPRVET